MAKTALITGITGQDGSILAALLQEKGYTVHGLRLYSAVPDEERIKTLRDVQLHYGDMTDGGNLVRLLDIVQPDEIYNMAAQSHVRVSFDVPEATANINALGCLRMLEAIRTVKADKSVRFYQASSSEMYGRTPAPQNENTAFEPCSPYGVAKLFAYWTVRNYREAYSLYAANGILFNHESPLRGEEFVTRKITKAVCEIEAGMRDKVTLGNLDAKRDWGHARDYMDGIWRILQQPQPDDYVLATGEVHTVREFVQAAFSYIGISLVWEGEGLQEVGKDAQSGKTLVDIDPVFFRPKEVHYLQGNPAKAQERLQWKHSFSFNDLVEDMMQADRLVAMKERLHVVG